MRACIPCRQRKSRCDRSIPCDKCNRSHLNCVYPEQPPRKVPSRQTSSPVPASPKIEDVHDEVQSTFDVLEGASKRLGPGIAGYAHVAYGSSHFKLTLQRMLFV
ncbi:MAG: Zn(II)2Cys6 transcription factor [Pedobacter sp.]|nr:MAG: Zn(II)2Cys6 transcription factor [Pedobacter sp.]